MIAATMIVVVMTVVLEVMPVRLLPTVRMSMSGRHRRAAGRLLGEVGRRTAIVLRIHQ